ncbi:formate dehydrogenase accessory sulfurtransferase FdhD [Slackia piriformis]|uniref:formate dehydrogenase accessory sulfurtransferase FdhD n=1 Tax=Slackia piriformis TaxID=626934 RepID=UPI0026DD5AAE|nr:formate dehydrogenase accessory sulfurtransferase FdhD [Slackia piriformis]MDO5023238.1 formate dehydrogenase accessory sulfurtransferase FdhD [Slackia piriformis]
MAVIEYCCPSDRATAERSVRIFLNDVLVAVSQGSPYGLAELAVGYLLSEGFIAKRESLLSVDVDHEDAAVHVRSSEIASAAQAPLTRVTSAGCALSNVWNMRPEAAASSGQNLHTAHFDADALLSCMDELCALSPRRNTGECVHGCGVAEAGATSLALVREDIGRHNAMDKLIGQAWLDRMDVAGCALFITGRISTEMALKAHRAGAAVLASRKSATDEAAWRAQELGLTLVSHCRDGSLRVLSCPDRI